FMAPSSQRWEPPRNPGRFILDGGRENPLIVDDEPWKLQSQAGKRTRDMITSLGIYLRDTKKSDNW
ncbi:hypothetical protein, partial [Malikia spinosa]|uniref:hypothetical protein n=1 Tax=Malikia spinosa TaxID=86180 RepID=UPI002FD9A8F8